MLPIKFTYCRYPYIFEATESIFLKRNDHICQPKNKLMLCFAYEIQTTKESHYFIHTTKVPTYIHPSTLEFKADIIYMVLTWNIKMFIYTYMYCTLGTQYKCNTADQSISDIVLYI